MNGDQRFAPQEITVAVGDTLTLRNFSAESHTVTAYDDGIPSDAGYFASGGFADESAARNDVAQGLIDEGESFQVTLEQPGTYRYFCIPHEQQGMTGTIIVER